MQDDTKKKLKNSANAKDNRKDKASGTAKKACRQPRAATSSETGTKTRASNAHTSNTTTTATASGTAPSKASRSSKKSRPSKNTPSRRLKPTPAPRAHGYLIAAVLIILGAIIFLMLFTFSNADITQETETTLNLFGMIGAWFANILLTLFGLAGFTFPAFFLLKGITTFCARPLDVKPSEIIGFSLLLATVCPLLTLLMKGTKVLDHPPGGVLGNWEAQFALNAMTEPVFTYVCAALALLALLLTTDTSLKNFGLGIVRLIVAVFRLLWRLLAATGGALHAFITRPRAQKEPHPEDDPQTPYDPYDDLSTNDLLGKDDEASESTHTPDDTSAHATDTPACHAEPCLPEDCPQTAEAASDNDTPIVLPEPCSAEEIADKLEEEDDLCEMMPNEEVNDATPSDKDEHPECDPANLQSEEGLAAILAKVLPGKTRPRATRRSNSVPAIEPEFDFNSIVKPEDIQPREANHKKDADEGKSAATGGILGNWKPRTIGKQSRILTPEASPCPDTRQPEIVPSAILTGEQKSFAPEVAMDTLALPDTHFRPRNMTNHILAQCDESMPMQSALSKRDEEKRGATPDQTRHTFKKGEQLPDEQKTGCAASDELALLVQNMAPTAHPSTRHIHENEKATPTHVADPIQNIDAFFRTGNDPAATVPPPSVSAMAARIRQTGLMNEIDITTAKPPRSAARDIITAVPARADQKSASPEADEAPARASEKTTRPAQEKTVLPGENEKHTRNAALPEAMGNTSPRTAETKISNVPNTLKPANGHAGFDVAETKKRASEEEINEAERVRQQTQDKKHTYQRPPLSILNYNPTAQKGYTQEELEDISTRIKEKFAEFRLTGEITHVCPGPVVTRFEFKPDPGIKVSRFQDLAQDLMMALEIISVRILAPIPGKGVVGIEIPNEHRNTIYLKEVLACDAFLHNKSVLTMALGQDTEGTPFVTNLAKMPHILVAGTTGSGKSVGINTMLCSLLYNATPDDVRLILVDPKCLELSIYKDIPHLLTPPITTPAETSAALDWACEEMERRYRLLQDLGVRNIENYNDLLQKSLEHPEEADPRVLEKLEQKNDDDTPKHTHLAYIVLVIDEFADLMMVAKKEIETQVARLAQKARAAGINMILATQRPSTNVITGVIKANFPARLAFKVQAVVDSQTILGHKGAEALLGRGDSIFQDPSTGLETRVHGCFVSDEEVQAVVDYLHTQGKPEYNLSITASKQENEADASLDDDPASKDDIRLDPAYGRAIELIRQTRKASTSYLQRELGIGYPKAGRIISQLEKEGMIGPADSKHNREVYL